MSDTRKETALRILLIANRTLIRLGIRTLLKGHFKIERMEEGTAEEAPALIARFQPQIIIHDIDDDSGGIGLLRATAPTGKASGWIVLSNQKDSQLIRSAYAAGAGAVVLKQHRVETLITAIQKVLGGGIWMDRTMLDTVLEQTPAGQSTSERAMSRASLLTKRENDVVKGIVKGYRNKRIAEELGISEVTVRHHLTAIFGKLRVSDRLGLLIYATHNGLGDTSSLPAPSQQ